MAVVDRDGGVPVHDTDDKYVTFKRDEFYKLVSGSAKLTEGTHDHRVSSMLAGADDIAIADAVVIRRQDYFASPALATYAAMIGIAVKLSMDPEVTAELMKVADYFERQSHLAADEGWKFPDV